MLVVGRQEERARIGAALDQVRRGSGATVLLVGDAGIGKSTLLDHARAEARGLTHLSMAGVESETELAFAGLTELLRPVMGEVAALPPGPSAALHGALAVHATPANPLAVNMALLDVLTAVAEARPVLVTVDDAQWLDQPSLAALSFAGRRLASQAVAIVLAARPDPPIAYAAPDGAVVRLGGLDEADARLLLAERRQLTAAGVDHLLRISSGNPLALLELPDVAGPVTAGRLTGPDPSPVGTRVRAAFRQRLDSLPSATVLAIGVVAADDGAALRELVAALEILGLRADDLAPAEEAGLVEVGVEVVTLRHPLLRSVAYDALSGPRRREVHAALAEVIVDRAALDRRTWHRAAAAVGPDEEVALALDDVARAAERRGALATTAHGFARAASLTSDEDDRARRLLWTADAWLAAGEWERSLDVLAQAERHAVAPELRADIAASTGQLEVYRAGPPTGTAILVAAADDIEPIDPVRACRLLTYAVNAATMAADAELAATLAQRAAACGDRAGGLSAVAGAMAMIEAGLLTGDGSVAERLEPLAALADVVITSYLAHAEHVVSLVTLADFVLENYERADRLLEVLVRRAHDTGRSFLLAFALVGRTELSFRRGRWAEASANVATDEWGLAAPLPGMGSWLGAVQARIEAGLGRSDDARAHADAALAGARAADTAAIEAWARAALGFLELSEGRPLAAVEHLEEVAAIFGRGGVTEPGFVWWAGDLIEALWRTGEVGRARGHLEVLQRRADETGRRWAQAVAARGAGLLATDAEEAEAAFARAEHWHRQLDAPFERARTDLLWGERRRSLALPDADAPLARAREVFEHLDARPWLARVDALLGAPGATEPVALTRQERQVAAIVGRGHTNREAADALFVSAKTVAFHLRNIYRKLGLRSRTELAVWIADHEEELATP